MRRYLHILLAAFLAASPIVRTSAKAQEQTQKTVALTILGRGVKAAEAPITVGIPFADGGLTSLDGVSLHDEKGEPIPFQRDVLATWVKPGSGSIKWALFDFRAKGLDKAQELHYTLRLDKPAKAPAASAVKLTRADGKLTLDTGKLRFTLKQKGCGLVDSASVDLNGNGSYEPDELVVPDSGGANGPYFVRADGTVFSAANDTNSEVLVEEEGPERVCINVSSDYVSDGGEHLCRCFTRIHAYSGMALLKLNHTFVFTADMNKLHMNDIGLRFNLPCSKAAFGLADGTQAAMQVPANLVQYEDDKYRVDYSDKSERKDGGAPGWMTALSGGKQVTVALTDFWQKFPNELSADKDGFAIHFWPAHNEVVDEPEMHKYNIGRLWFAHHGKTMDLKTPENLSSFQIEGYSDKKHNNMANAAKANAAGVARSFEVYLSFGASSGQPDAFVGSAVVHRPLCVVDPAYACSTKVYGDIMEWNDKLLPEVGAAMARCFEFERRLGRKCGDFGKWVYGNGHTGGGYGLSTDEYFVSHHRVWRNFHHGVPRGPWLLYAHFGETNYWDYAMACAEVNLDIGICHEDMPELSKEPGYGKIKGYMTDYKGIVPWHKGNRSSYNSVTDFMFYYYYNTGNRWGIEVAREYGDARKKHASIPTRKSFSYGARGWVGPMNACLNLYRGTGDEHHLKEAEAYLDKLHNVQLSRGGFWDRWYTYAPAFVNYYELTGDERCGRLISRWAAYVTSLRLAERSGLPIAELGNEYFTGYGFPFLNIMAYAHKITGQEKFLQYGKGRMLLYSLGIFNEPAIGLHGKDSNTGLSHTYYFFAQAPTFLKELAAVDGNVTPMYPLWKVKWNARIVFDKEYGKPLMLVVHYHNTSPKGKLVVTNVQTDKSDRLSRYNKKYPLDVCQRASYANDEGANFNNIVTVELPPGWGGQCHVDFADVSDDFFIWAPIETDCPTRMVYTLPEKAIPVGRLMTMHLGVTEPRPEVEVNESYIMARGPFGFLDTEGRMFERCYTSEVPVDASSRVLTVRDPLPTNSLIVFASAGAVKSSTKITRMKGLTRFFACSKDEFFVPPAEF